MKSRWIKLCSILLVLTMLINMLPVHALALDSEDRGSALLKLARWRCWSADACLKYLKPMC